MVHNFPCTHTSKPARPGGFRVVVLGKGKEGMNAVEAMDCFQPRSGKSSRKLSGAGSGQPDTVSCVRPKSRLFSTAQESTP